MFLKFKENKIWQSGETIPIDLNLNIEETIEKTCSLLIYAQIFEKIKWHNEEYVIDESQLELNFRGQQQMKLITVEHEGKQKFQETKNVLKVFKNGLKEGKYVVPFKLKLGDDLPNSLSLKSDEQFILKYIVKCELINSDEQKLLQCKKKYEVQQKNRKITYQDATLAVKLTSLFCIPKGQCLIKLGLEKHDFTIGEIICGSIVIQNEQQKVQVKTITLQLVKNFCFTDDEKKQQKETEILETKIYTSNEFDPKVETNSQKIIVPITVLPINSQENQNETCKNQFEVDNYETCEADCVVRLYKRNLIEPNNTPK